MSDKIMTPEDWRKNMNYNHHLDAIEIRLMEEYADYVSAEKDNLISVLNNKNLQLMEFNNSFNDFHKKLLERCEKNDAEIASLKVLLFNNGVFL